MNIGSGVRPYVLSVVFGVLALSSTGEAVEPEVVREHLRKAARYLQDISLNGGYPSSYSLDQAEQRRTNKNQKTTTDIQIHPPGTPSMGDAFLQAWRATGEHIYLEGALSAARALVWSQKKSGGWGYHADVKGLKPDRVSAHRPGGASSFDDAMTQGPLLFLMKLDRDVDKKWLTKSIHRGLSFLLEAQFDNGAWPQWYPLKGGYHDYYTFNDGAINDCIDVLMHAHRQYGEDKYLKAIRRAGNFVVRSQGDPPQTGWAQQYKHNMAPAWARGFEPPGICSLVTARNIRTLVELYLYIEDDRYLSPIPDAIEWLQNAKIDQNRWARLYDVESNRPVYGDRKDPNKKHFDYEDISEAERSSYAWQGSYGIPEAIEFYREVKDNGAAGYKEMNPGAPVLSLGVGGLTATTRGMSPSADRIQEIIQAQDKKGRWVTDGRIRITTFVERMNALSNYLHSNSEGEK